MHSFDKGRTKKLKESPTLSVGPPKKPVEVPKTLEYKTLGKSLGGMWQLKAEKLVALNKIYKFQFKTLCELTVYSKIT